MNNQERIGLDATALHSYDFIFHEIILPISEEIEAEVDPEFKIICDFEKLNTEKVYEISHKFYRKKRESLKNFFYGEVFLNEKSVNYDDYCLDLHKIASIITATLIRNKLFWFDEGKAKKYIDSKDCSTEWKIDNLLINYKLAFYVGVALMYYKMLFDAKGNDTQESQKLYKKIEMQGGLYLYPKNELHESFPNSIIYDFAKRDINNRSFDYLLYSALLYQLEEYNREKFNKI